MSSLPRIVELYPPQYDYYKNCPAARSWVYEVWDTRDRLAYVGIADDFDRRWRQHVDKSWWLHEIQVAQIFVEGYFTRDEARQIEAEVINSQSPVYNTSRELAAYRRYKAFDTDPSRPWHDFELVPVKKRYFEGREEEWHAITHPSASTSGMTITSDR